MSQAIDYPANRAGRAIPGQALQHFAFGEAGTISEPFVAGRDGWTARETLDRNPYIGSANLLGVGLMTGTDHLGVTAGVACRRYKVLDRLETPLRKGEDRLEFLITESYEDGTFGGCLLRAGDANGLVVEYYEEVTMNDFEAWGWAVIDSSTTLSGLGRSSLETYAE